MTTVNNLGAKFSDSSKDKQVNAQHAAALQGALLAFAKPLSKPSISATRATRMPGATAIGEQARYNTQPPTPKRPTLSSGSSSLFTQLRVDDLSLSTFIKVPPSRSYTSRSSPSQLAIPASDIPLRSKSPSNIAAVLASQSYALRTQQHAQKRRDRLRPTMGEGPKEQMPVHGTVSQVRNWLQALDSTPLEGVRTLNGSPSPDLLVTMSSPNKRQRAGEGLLGEVMNAQGPPPTIQSPKPLRTSSTAVSIETAASNYNLAPALFGLDGAMPPAHKLRQSSSATHLPAARTRPRTVSRSQSPPLIPRQIPHNMKRNPPTSDRPVSQFSSRRITPHMTGDSFANAIVASKLASARSPSPSKSPAPPLSRLGHTEKSHHVHLHPFKHAHPSARTPSPAKAMAMRHTMRKERSSSSSDDANQPHKKHNKLFAIRKHPHKHHEGDRKRWRDEITDRERKRYEGVWAANRGLHIAFTDDELQSAAAIEAARNCVLGLVVRDLWCRSRLHGNVLEEVWDLVDRERVGRLNKDEFIVGLWLVDQRLRGRKLPIKVSASVWRSARGMQWLKVPKVRD